MPLEELSLPSAGDTGDSFFSAPLPTSVVAGTLGEFGTPLTERLPDELSLLPSPDVPTEDEVTTSVDSGRESSAIAESIDGASTDGLSTPASRTPIDGFTITTNATRASTTPSSRYVTLWSKRFLATTPCYWPPFRQHAEERTTKQH